MSPTWTFKVSRVGHFGGENSQVGYHIMGAFIVYHSGRAAEPAHSKNVQVVLFLLATGLALTCLE